MAYVSCIFCCNGVTWMESVEEGGGKGIGGDCAISSCINVNLKSLHMGGMRRRGEEERGGEGKEEGRRRRGLFCCDGQWQLVT